MKFDVKQKWVEALRSGEYQQGKDALRSEDKFGKDQYCCLGVLCEVVGGGEWEDFDGHAQRYNYGHTKGVELLPQQLAEDVGLDREPTVRVETEDGSHDWVELTSLNDGLDGYEARSFEEIADLIENTHI